MLVAWPAEKENIISRETFFSFIFCLWHGSGMIAFIVHCFYLKELIRGEWEIYIDGITKS